MTRRLPWKRQIDRSAIGTPKPATPTPVKPQKAKRDDSDEVSPAPSKKIKKSTPSPAAPNKIPRAGSTSPPPEPLPESHMIEGLENDDLYRMVEDEFLSTAQQFTAHLHAAEYHRLKAASKSQNADTIRNISRPVVGRMTDLVKKKQDRKTRFQKQKEVIKKASANRGQNSDTESQDDSWRSASLYGLMESPRKQAARLDNLTKPVTTTRAAAGFSTVKTQASLTTPHRSTINSFLGRNPLATPALKDASETDDDGNYNQASPPLEIRTKSSRKPSSSTPQVSKPKQAHNATNDSPSLRYPAKVAQHNTRTITPKVTQDADLPDDAETDFLARLKRRQEDRNRNREQRKLAVSKAQSKRSMTDDIIPGFL